MQHAPIVRGGSIAIPAGVVLAGSLPGIAGRHATYEADLVPVEVPAFEIDRLPYPNDPAEPAQLGASRPEAAAMCAARGQRLCSELEWERACKADTALDWPSPLAVDPEICNRDPFACASPFDVLAMGDSAMEWTSSEVSRRLGNAEHHAVLRGGSLTQPATEHRCSARHALAPESVRDDVAFRCCRGSIEDERYPEEAPRPLFEALEADREALRVALARIEWLAPYATTFEPSTDADVDRALGGGGKTRADVQMHFVSGLLSWAPIPGEHAWVFTGRSERGGLIVVLHPMPDGSFVPAASFELRGEQDAIAIGYDHTSPTTLYWASCWGCPGENGTIALREDGRIVIAQQ